MLRQSRHLFVRLDAEHGQLVLEPRLMFVKAGDAQRPSACRHTRQRSAEQLRDLAVGTSPKDIVILWPPHGRYTSVLVMAARFDSLRTPAQLPRQLRVGHRAESRILFPLPWPALS